MPIKWVTTSKEYTMLPDGTFRMDVDGVPIWVPDDDKRVALFGGTWVYGQTVPTSGTTTTTVTPTIPTYRRATHDASGLPKQVAQSAASQVWADTYPVGPMTDADWRTLPDISERVKAYCQTYRLRLLGSGDVEEALEKLVGAKLVEVQG